MRNAPKNPSEIDARKCGMDHDQQLELNIQNMAPRKYLQQQQQQQQQQLKQKKKKNKMILRFILIESAESAIGPGHRLRPSTHLTHLTHRDTHAEHLALISWALRSISDTQNLLLPPPPSTFPPFPSAPEFHIYPPL